MDIRITDALKNQVTTAKFYSHVSLFDPKRKYSIDRNNIEAFWQLYCDLVNDEEDIKSGIAEIPQTFLPVVVDVDLKIRVNTKEQKPLHNKEEVETIVGVYQNVLRKILDKCTDKDLICLVLEKPPYIDEKKNGILYLKHGFHLHFPYIFLARSDQEEYLLPNIYKTLKNMGNIFENPEFSDYTQIIDKNYLKTPWLLYGSRKNAHLDPYKVTMVIDSTGNEMDLDDALGGYPIYNQQENLIIMTEQQSVKYYLPRILSIVPFNREISSIQPELNREIKHFIARRRNNNQDNEPADPKTMEMVKKLMQMVADFRSDDHNEWMNIGWTLYNIGNGSDEALEIWKEFSQKSDKYDEGTCVQNWDRMVRKNLTIGTLRWLASKDNPVAYSEFRKENSDKYIQEAINGSHNDIARMIYEDHGTEFICATSERGGIWYRFQNHIWVQTETVVLRKKLSEMDFLQQFVDISTENTTKFAQCDKAEQAMYNVKIKQSQKIINNLKSAPFKNNVIRECTEQFLDLDFLKKLDTSESGYLIAFNNGVYELKTNTFRPGKPEDFLSKKMPIDYVIMDDNDSRVKNVNKFLQEVFPDTSIRNYFLDVSATVFVAGNHKKLVLLWTGEGDNGKSITQQLFESMLGPYAIKLPTSSVTGKRTQSSAATPELARLDNGVRWVVLDETEGMDNLNVGMIKQLSGNDSMYIRKLYGAGKEIKNPAYKVVIICNKPPKVPYADQAFWNRLRVIPFESTFPKNPKDVPATYEEQFCQKIFPRDEEFDSKIPDMVQAFAWMLLQRRKNGIRCTEPDKVLLATDKYRKRNDIYRQFIEEIIVEKKEEIITIQEIFSSFKDWLRESTSNTRMPDKIEIKEYFEKLWGSPKKNKWKGYKLRTIEDDDDNAFIYSGQQSGPSISKKC